MNGAGPALTLWRCVAHTDHRAADTGGHRGPAPQRSLQRGVEVMYGSPMRNCAIERSKNVCPYVVLNWTLAKMDLNRLTIYGPRGLLRARIDNRAFLSHGSPAHAP